MIIPCGCFIIISPLYLLGFLAVVSGSARAPNQTLLLSWKSAASGYFTLIQQRKNNVPVPSLTFPKQTQTSSAAFSATCPDGTAAVPFETKILLSLVGRPSLISTADTTLLEEGFVVAYNDLQNCTLSGTSQILDNATIILSSALD